MVWEGEGGGRVQDEVVSTDRRLGPRFVTDGFVADGAWFAARLRPSGGWRCCFAGRRGGSSVRDPSAARAVASGGRRLKGLADLWAR